MTWAQTLLPPRARGAESPARVMSGRADEHARCDERRRARGSRHDIPTPRAVLRVVAVVVLSGLALYLLYLVRVQLGLLVAGAVPRGLRVRARSNALSRHMKRGFAI